MLKAIISVVAASACGTVACAQQAPIIPPDRVTVWRPGVTYNGGIPHRTNVFRTLSPLGGTQDDTPRLQAALDGCLPEHVVQLTVGTFRINGSLRFHTSNCTLRGSGPGALADGNGGTRLVKVDASQVGAMYVHPADFQDGESINLEKDAAQGAYTASLAKNPGIKVGEIVFIDQITTSHPDVFWGPVHNPPGGPSRSWFSRQDRSLSQVLEVSDVSGSTLTFSTPLRAAFKNTYGAQVTRFTRPFLRRVGIENLYVHGGKGGHGNIAMSHCAYCWIKGVNAHWSVGSNVGFRTTFRSELRDSYIHETPDPNPGGAGYQTSIDYGASDNLFENNAIWYGNKVIIMRATGGGNVVAYNYMDDAFISYYPHGPEAGVNAGHYTTPHMELIEGNYSHNYKGDSYWGNSINITVFRNWLSALRAARPPLDTYSFSSGPCTFRYGDYSGRTAVDILAYNFSTNFVGNVLGMPNQQLVGYDSHSCFSSFQKGWAYENLDGSLKENIVVMWNMGGDQSHQAKDGNWAWVADTYQTQLREGNWDWVTKSQRWHGIGGKGDGNGAAKPIPNSLYLNAAPAFFGGKPWPWVDPSTGATHTLPAKYCLERNQMPTCLGRSE